MTNPTLVIAFMHGEKCAATGETIFHSSVRHLSDSHKYVDGVSTPGGVSKPEALADFYNIMTEICGYKQGTNAYIVPDEEQTAKLVDAFSGKHGFCEGGMTEFASSDLNLEKGILILTNDDEPGSIPEVCYKLTAISLRERKPHGFNLNGAFGKLHNIAWLDNNQIALASEVNQYLHKQRLQGDIIGVDLIDKFPRMTRYVVPTGVRIAHAARIRLGAYIGEGTTIMHEGFVNFNAGTEGPGMIEGRISAGVFVGAGSDVGGGASTMGTLSGGGNIVISVGKECLLGANAGIGIPLGDRCIVEAGLYITAGTKVIVFTEDGKEVGESKARELAGVSDLLFRRNSITGTIECKTNKTAIELNNELHAHN